MFKVCAICGLSLPVSIMSPIRVNHQGRDLVVGICDNCKLKKEREAIQRRNNDKTTN